MNEDNNLPEEEKFSEDPEENTRMENDFLKMKMMAESGAWFGGEGGLPPEIENQFLKNVMEFEKTNANTKPGTIYDILGNPVFEEESSLDEEKFQIEFSRLNGLLEEYGIHVGFNREREDRFKYNFITQELFTRETFTPVKGMVTAFLYEEFYPDHELEITELTDRFLTDFFERDLNTDTYYINEQIVHPEGQLIPREDIIKRFLSMYEAIPEFENTSFEIENQDFELYEKEGVETGMGFSEGTIQYDLIFRDGKRKKVNGPFKIYFSMEWGCWLICFFYLAGYNLHPKEKD
ncbi:MAG: hypothetical protein ABI237_17560 [Ginsengibacter sp.]